MATNSTGKSLDNEHNECCHFKHLSKSKSVPRHKSTNERAASLEQRSTYPTKETGGSFFQIDANNRIILQHSKLCYKHKLLSTQQERRESPEESKDSTGGRHIKRSSTVLTQKEHCVSRINEQKMHYPLGERELFRTEDVGKYPCKGHNNLEGQEQRLLCINASKH